MLDTGAPHNLPYPELAIDPPNGPAQIQALAVQTAARLGSVGQNLVATQQTRSNAAFGLLSSADRVQGVVVPSNSILQVRYFATWKQSAVGVARAAIFIGSNQVRTVQNGSPGPALMEAFIDNDSASFFRPLVTDSRRGLVTLTGDDEDYTGNVATGQLLGGQSAVDVEGGALTASYGGPAEFFVETGGTFDVSVQFATSFGGTVTVKNRKLWVRVLP